MRGQPLLSVCLSVATPLEPLTRVEQQTHVQMNME